MKVILTATVLAASFAMTAFAHDGVEGEHVKARMMSMKTIGGSLKTLSTMAKGGIEFDAAAAQAAVDEVAAQAAAIPDLFEVNEADPTSDAKPEIWTNWDDFVAKSDVLQVAAEGAVITDQASIGAALGAIGQTCGACHKVYRN